MFRCDLSAQLGGALAVPQALQVPVVLVEPTDLAAQDLAGVHGAVLEDHRGERARGTGQVSGRALAGGDAVAGHALDVLVHQPVAGAGQAGEREVEVGQHAFVEEPLLDGDHLAVAVGIDFEQVRLHGRAAREVDGHVVRAQLADQLLQVLGQHVLAEHLEELVRELRPDNVTVNLARGTAMEPHLLEVDPDRYREVVAVKQRLFDEGVLPYFDFPLARLARARDGLMYEHVERVARNGVPAGQRPPGHLPCTAGTLSAVVFEDGAVHPCEILGREIGRLDEHDWDLERLWYGERAAELRGQIAAEHCSCTWECAQADNVLFNKRAWPALARRVLQRSERG